MTLQGPRAGGGAVVDVFFGATFCRYDVKTPKRQNATSF
jgi:hypothetical protein